MEAAFDTFFNLEGRKKQEDYKLALQIKFELRSEKVKFNQQLANAFMVSSLKSLYGEIGSAKFSLNMKSFDLLGRETEVLVDYNYAREFWAAVVSQGLYQEIEYKATIVGITPVKPE